MAKKSRLEVLEEKKRKIKESMKILRKTARIIDKQIENESNASA